MWRSASATCTVQGEACQSSREEPSTGAPAVQREEHWRGREEPSAPTKKGDGSPMHWLTLVFSDSDEEMFFRRNTLVANKTLILAVGGTGLSCLVLPWAAAARNGPHALWTLWSIVALTVILMYLLADRDSMERLPEEGISPNNRDGAPCTCRLSFTEVDPKRQRYTSNLCSAWHHLVAANAYLASFGLALLYGLEPLADFEYAVWCVAGLLQLLFPFLLAYPPRSKVGVYLVNFVGYSALALGGYFGDRLRAICTGGLLLGASLTLGSALERVKRLAFLHVRRDKVRGSREGWASRV
jgi:hypothetical protein